MFEYRKAKNVSLVQIIELVNDVFKDYIVPVHWSLDTFELDCREQSIDMNESFIVFDDEKPAGFAMLSIRSNRSRIDAIGVRKEYRGTGLAAQMLTKVVEQMKWHGIESIVLEVADAESRAIKFYEKHNFKTRRMLISLKYEFEGTPAEPQYSYLSEDFNWLHEAAMESLQNLKRRPNWQREPKTLKLSETRYTINKINKKGSNIGYVVWGKNDDLAFIVDVSPTVDETKFKAIFEDTISMIAKERKRIIIVSVPENDILYDIATKSGFEPFLVQREMEIKIH